MALRTALTGALPERALRAEGEVQTRIVLEAALERLTRKQWAVLVLRCYEDLSEAQTAEILGCSLGIVRRLSSLLERPCRRHCYRHATLRLLPNALRSAA